jgi:hypothetical protein
MSAADVAFVVAGLVTAYCLGWGMGMTFLTFKSFMDKIL